MRLWTAVVAALVTFGFLIATFVAGVQGKAEDAPTAVLPVAEATDRLAIQPAARRPERPGRRGKILFALLGVAVLAAAVIGVVLTSNHSGKVGVPTFVGKSDRHAARLSQQIGLKLEMVIVGVILFTVAGIWRSAAR